MNEVEAIDRAAGVQAGEGLIDPLGVTAVGAARSWAETTISLAPGSPARYASFVSATPSSPVNWSTISSAILCARRRNCGAATSNFLDAIRRYSGVVRS